MSVKKRLQRQAAKFTVYQDHINQLQAEQIAKQELSLNPFDLQASVESELLQKKETARKARNKRKANSK